MLKFRANALAIFGAFALLAMSVVATPAMADGGSPCQHMRYEGSGNYGCPAGQVGSISAKCSFNGCGGRTYCNTANGPYGTGWKITSNTCKPAVAFSHNSHETRTETCPTTQPSGVINQRRDFEVWSDGSRKNYSAWYETDRTCAAIKSSTAKESQTLTCPDSKPSGTWLQERTYEIWTDGSNKNYGEWADVSVCSNGVPVAQALSLITDEDTPASVTLSATDDHDTISFELVTSPSNGHVQINGSTLTFQPGTDWNGSTNLTYRAIDPYGAYSDAALVNITVYPINDAPVAHPLTMHLGQYKSGTLLLRASDIDSTGPFAFEIVNPPSNVDYSLEGALLEIRSSGKWNGQSRLTYRAQDDLGAWSAPAAVVISVVPSPAAQVKAGMAEMEFRVLIQDMK